MYVIMGVFVVGSASGMYMCLTSILSFIKNIPEGKSFTLPLCGTMTVKSTIILLISFSLPIIWIIFRHNSAIWILQDLLGASMILGVFRTVHLPNFKIAVILLALFFVYDIFFVFITPLFTNDGKSIMVKVATGGDNQQEILPLTIMFPHLLDPFEGICGPPGYSILGFGDVLMPGLVISYCLAFDTMQGTFKRKLYFLVSLLAYVVGLFLTYVALLLMQAAQPALLYLVPCVLGSVALVGLKRGELKLLWTGTATEPVVPDKSFQSEENPTVPSNGSTQSENIPLIISTDNDQAGTELDNLSEDQDKNKIK